MSLDTTPSASERIRLETHAWPGSYSDEARPRVGFFTDTSLCIGCKACEVACKEWNQIPDSPKGFTGHSYDNTIDLDADTWRHVAFVEQRLPADLDNGASLVDTAQRSQMIDGGLATLQEGDGFRWLMSSDVCKHCTEAACVEVCPTGALFRTEFGTVVVQEDVCNGCGYCVPACPFGVLDQRKDDGRVWKCTLCYDRLKDDKEPACAQACPTNSIQFGELSVLREHAQQRLVSSPRPDRTRRSFTSPTSRTVSGAPAPSSSCSTSPKSTVYPPIRWTPCATSARSGRRPPGLPARSAWACSSPPSAGADDHDRSANGDGRDL